MTPQEAAAKWNAATTDRPYYKHADPTNTPGSDNFADDISSLDIGTFGSQTEAQLATWTEYLAALDEPYKRTVAQGWFQTLDLPNVFHQTPPAPAEVPHTIDALPVGTTITRTETGVSVAVPGHPVEHHVGGFNGWLHSAWHWLSHLHF